MPEDTRWRSGPKMDKDVKRLLGLRDFPARTEAEKKEILGSDMRVQALDAIDTTTRPRTKREIKKGIVLEATEKKLIEENILEKDPVIYIGSGTDVEYPLALGARNIVLVDPIFTVSEAVAEVKKRIESIISGEVEGKNGTLAFEFDYGRGLEPSAVSLVAKPYHDEKQEGDYEIPNGVGGILLYAPQSQAYTVKLQEDVWEKIAPNGFIIDEYDFLRRREGSAEVEKIELGSE